VLLARLLRARGIRGEITAAHFGSTLERFEGLKATLADPREAVPAAEVEVESAWEHNGLLVLKFRGMDTRTDAESIQGFELRVPLLERPPVRAGEYYLTDLIGCEVVERNGNSLGRVIEWQDVGAGLLVVGDEELMIPFARSFCVEIDLAARRIVVELPEGLKELGNKPGRA
jgi:16S rRNA processing protein RimM